MNEDEILEFSFRAAIKPQRRFGVGCPDCGETRTGTINGYHCYLCGYRSAGSESSPCTGKLQPVDRPVDWVENVAHSWEKSQDKKWEQYKKILKEKEEIKINEIILNQKGKGTSYVDDYD